MKIRTIAERVLHLSGFGCGDTERLLFDFIQEELPADVRTKLEKHLSGCRSCMKYVASYRNTIRATHDHALPEIEMPLELQQRLKEFIAQNPNLR